MHFLLLIHCRARGCSKLNIIVINSLCQISNLIALAKVSIIDIVYNWLHVILCMRVGFLMPAVSFFLALHLSFYLLAHSLLQFFYLTVDIFAWLRLNEAFNVVIFRFFSLLLLLSVQFNPWKLVDGWKCIVPYRLRTLIRAHLRKVST